MSKKAKKKAAANKAQKNAAKAVEKKQIVAPAETVTPAAPVEAAPVEAPAAKAVSKAPAAKAAKAKKPAQSAEKKAASAGRKANAKDASTVVYVQYQGVEESVEDLVERIKVTFKAEHKRTAVEQVNIYIKPEDRAAYYVINDRFAGKVDF